MRLLLVEDDVMIGESVVDLLRDDGYAVDWVKDGAMADSTLESQTYELVLLDLGLPKLNGISVLKRMRSRKDQTPVLIATAHDGLEERIEGLDSGADDYVVKPYELDEVMARIRALVRRAHGSGDLMYSHMGVNIDARNREVRVNGSAVVLSAREWAVLRELLLRPGAILSRKQIEDRLYSWKDEVSSNAVEVYIHGLRKKLGPAFIQTVRGVGYMIPKGPE